MKPLLILIAIAAILAGCAEPERPVAGGGKETPKEYSFGDYALGQPITKGNVTIVPVSFSKTKSMQGQQSTDALTLTEAKKLGVVEIVERPGEEEVNSLKVRNLGDRPIMLLGGELLLGGKQDRIVAKDVIVPPRSTVDVDVYCVEHGRWSGESKHFDYSMSTVPTKVREAATYGSQQEVWDKVQEYNVSAGRAMDSEGTVMKGLSSEAVQTALKDNLPEISKALESNPGAVGVIFVMNGQIQTMDLFDNPRLFQSSRDSLLKGYLSQAATGPQDPRPVSLPSCLEFLKDSVSIPVQTPNAGEAATFRGENENAKGAYLRGVEKDGSAAKTLHGVYTPKK